METELVKLFFLVQFVSFDRKVFSIIAIWTSDAKKKKSVMAIGNKLKEYLRLDSDFKLYYELHSAEKNSKPLYTI